MDLLNAKKAPRSSKMKKAGCLVVYFGIESADDEILKVIRKPFTVEQVRKAIKDAKKNLNYVPLVDGTLPHPIVGKCRATQITLLPASPGTGVIAGSTARSILEYAGVRNVLTKVHGSRAAKNVVKAVDWRERGGWF